MMLAAEIYDVSPQTSAVTTLRTARGRSLGGGLRCAGARARVGSSGRSLTTCWRSPRRSITSVASRTRRPPRSAIRRAAMFCYQVAAYDRAQRRDRLADHVRQFGRHAARECRSACRSSSRRRGRACSPSVSSRGAALPAWASRTGFRLLDPVKSVRNQIEFTAQLHDREALLAREGQRRFLEADGWVAWPGPAMAEFLRQFIAHNRLLEGGFVIEDRLVTLAESAAPDPVRGRHRRRDRARGRRARDPAGRAAGRDLRARAPRRTLRTGRRHESQRGHVANRGGLDALASRRRRAT